MGNTRSASRIVSIKLPPELDEELDEIARRREISRSAVIREALILFARGPRRSVTALAADLVGSLSGPRDLSTGKKWMSGFGE